MDQSARRRTREGGGKMGRKTYSTTRPSGNSCVRTSSLPENALIDQNILKSIPVADLLSGFLEVKQKMSQLWTSFDKAENGQAVMDSLTTVNFAVRTLQEIAGAVMEREPHTAVYSQIFEDMWLFGFTRPSNICVKYEQNQLVQADQTTVSSIRAWRRDFLTNWTGFLYKLQDTFQLFRNPEKMLQLMPHQTHTMLPPRHPGLILDSSVEDDKTTTDLKKRLYELPLTYLLRDIALCLARTCGHENRELERVWIERAYRINASIAGSRYKDAWARLNGQLQEATKVDSSKDEKPSYPLFDYAADATVNQVADEEAHSRYDVGDTASGSSHSNDETEYKREVRFQIDPQEDEDDETLVGVCQHEDTLAAGSGLANTAEEPAEPKSLNMEFLERASGRNAFLQGLLERAAGANIGTTEVPSDKLNHGH